MKQYKVEALFEVDFNANGSNFLLIYGKHINGYYCCIPNWKIGCEMADPDDTFYNYEKLRGAGLNKADANAVALTIKKVGAEHPAKLRNYGEITFERDLPEYDTVDEGATSDGHNYKLATAKPGNCYPCNEPIVLFNGRAFILHWEDIVALAEKADLFDDAESIFKALTTGKGVEL